MSAKTKFKLTAHEGCRVRKVALVSLASAGSEERLENCLACLTNLGDIHIFTVPGLRPQVHYGCIRKEDISGIASCVFTKHGQGEGTSPALGVMSLVDGTLSLAAAPRRGSLRLFVVVPPPPLGFYLISPSEFERFSLSARNVTEPLCRLEVSRLQDTSCLRWDGHRGHGGFATAAPLYPHPMAPAPAVTSPPTTPFPSSNSSTATPKLPQANGTHVPRSPEGRRSPTDSDRE